MADLKPKWIRIQAWDAIESPSLFTDQIVPSMKLSFKFNLRSKLVQTLFFQMRNIAKVLSALIRSDFNPILMNCLFSSSLDCCYYWLAVLRQAAHPDLSTQTLVEGSLPNDSLPARQTKVCF